MALLGPRRFPKRSAPSRRDGPAHAPDCGVRHASLSTSERVDITEDWKILGLQPDALACYRL